MVVTKNTEKPIELIDVNKIFISGDTGAFSKKTTLEERQVIIQRLNGFDISDEKRRFVDMFIYTGFNYVEAYRTVFDPDGEMSNQMLSRKAHKMINEDKNVVNYLTFIREQSLNALGISDKAEFYVKKIVDELYSSIEGDIYDYTNFKNGMFEVRDPEELTTRQRRRVKKIRITTVPLKSGGTKTILDVELYDKQKQIELLMKHLKMFTKRGHGETTSDRVKEVIRGAEEAVEAAYTEITEDGS